VRGSWYESGGEAFVAAMQAVDLRDRDDLPDATAHDWTWVGAILVERKMGARSVVVPSQNLIRADSLVVSRARHSER